MKKILALALLILAACETAPAGYQAQPFNYAGRPPIRLNVAEIKVVENYQSPLRDPNVEQDFPTPPASAVKQWAQARLVAAGQSGTLEVSIDDASAKAVKLKKTEGVKALFTDDQDTRYDASLHVTFRLYNGTQALSVANGDVSITRSKSINEKATINDRQKLFDGMTHEMMATLDAQAETRLRQYFSNYLK